MLRTVKSVLGGSPPDPRDPIFKVFVVIYLVILLLCAVFNIGIGLPGAAVLALLLFGILAIILGLREPDAADRRRPVLIGLFCISIPLSIFLGFQMGGYWAWAAVILALVVCLVMGGLQKGWSLGGSIALTLFLLGGGLILTMLASHNTPHKPTQDQINSAQRAFQR